LRRGDSPEQITALIAARWGMRRDRGAEERLGSRARSPLLPVSELRKDPHLEMHTRGG
jgi:cyclic pyranopterin phosphate synthase